MSDDLINTRLGQYRLIEVLGHGGMATVYKAHQSSLDRYVAVKVLLHKRDPNFVLRFKREAQTSARLTHPNIIPVHDYGEQKGLLYLVMQYVENGTTLNDLLGTPMAPAQALRLVGHLLNALEYAHSCGVIHRDIKLSNILMTTANWPMLADFGIAKLMDESMRFTQSGMIIGTLAYMAPEQATGQPVDRRADLYSSGVVLYRLLTGRVPFDADMPYALLHQHVSQPPPLLRSLNPDLPMALENVALRALAKDPADRYQTAAEMAEAIAQVAAQLDPPRRPNQLDRLYVADEPTSAAQDIELTLDQFDQVVTGSPDYGNGGEILKSTEAAQQPAVIATQQTLQAAPAPQTSLPIELATQPKLAVQDAFPVVELPPLKQVPARPQLSRRWIWAGLSGVIALLVLFALIATSMRSQAFSPRSGTGPSTLAATSVQVAQVDIAEPTAMLVVAQQPTATELSTATPTPTDAPPSATPLPTDAPPSATPLPTVVPPDAIVSADLLNLRRGPGQQFTSVGSYEQGTVLAVTGRDTSSVWLQVQAPDRRIGWMLKEHLKLNVALESVPVIVPTPAPPTRTARPIPRAPQPAPAQPTDAPQPPAQPPAQPTEPPAQASPLPTDRPDQPPDQPTNTPKPPDQPQPTRTRATPKPTEPPARPVPTEPR